jgi:hypothetical protein
MGGMHQSNPRVEDPPRRQRVEVSMTQPQVTLGAKVPGHLDGDARR